MKRLRVLILGPDCDPRRSAFVLWPIRMPQLSPEFMM